ncbi:MAG: phosphoenolpyruvate synthase, partial [Planctomycetes bacterium]|nr:phosphoenolpyruvate synthase [Planctomycetota bacterium]
MGTRMLTKQKSDWIRPFSDISINDVPSVGGKNASLGEMYRELVSSGVRVPNGFAITVGAYWYFLSRTGVDRTIEDIIRRLIPDDLQSLQECGRAARQAILSSELPVDLREAILSAYQSLSGPNRNGVDVAVRSSATAEDLPEASFAGQQETYLNVEGQQALLETCKRCFASLFTDRAISYRRHQKLEHLKVGLSVGVQLMVRSDLASSGVMFSIDTETGFRDAVLVNAAYGLGENVVQGAVNPDEFLVFKPTLMEGFKPILRKRVGNKEFKMIYDVGGGRMTRNVPVSVSERQRFAINDDEILTLARWAVLIEKHYSEKHGHLTPMDIEWAKDGRTGELWIVQARPETVQSQKQTDYLETYSLKQKG